ncbi:hypothetical protein [Thermaurantimonas sp.]
MVEFSDETSAVRIISSEEKGLRSFFSVIPLSSFLRFFTAGDG